MNKRLYCDLAIDRLSVQSEQSILQGSLTSVPIMIGEVTVENYQAGFNEDGNDFKEISFD